MRSGRHGCALLIVLAALLAAGCGSSGSTTTGAPGTDAEPISEAGVTVAQIENYPAGSPEATVLEWWRDLQLNDPESARSLYLEPPSVANLAGQFNYVAGDFDGKVTILSRKEAEGTAQVRVRWSAAPGESKRVTLRLVPDGDVWKLADARFVDQEVSRLQQEEAAE